MLQYLLNIFNHQSYLLILYSFIFISHHIGGGTRGAKGAMAPQILLVMLLAPSDYVPFNKCKDFFAVNEHRKNYFGTF